MGPSNKQRRQRRPRRASGNDAPRAFTLIELLVVIGVITLLIGLIVPVLSGARQRGRDAACLANHRQFAVAYGLYFIDYDNFPVANDDGSSIFYMYTNTSSWGGVDWFGREREGLPVWLIQDRPVNKYLQNAQNEFRRAEVFMCPSDDSMRYTSSDERITWEEFGADTHAIEGATTVFAVVGSSYFLNDWCYVDPQATRGAMPGFGTYRTNLGPDDVLVSPSRFVLMCDAGQWAAGRFSVGMRREYDMVYGWWHGYEIGNILFLDGSARREEMGAAVTKTYSFYSNPSVQAMSGRRMAWTGN